MRKIRRHAAAAERALRCECASARRACAGIDNYAAVWYNCGMSKIDESENAGESGAIEFCAPEHAEAAAPAAPEKKRVIKSVKSRMGLSYLTYAVVLLTLLWTTFFIFLYSIYGQLQTSEFRDVGREASAIFPIRADDLSMRYYVERIKHSAREDGVSAAVFEVDGDGDLRVLFSVDSMGNVKDESTEAFEIIMSELRLDDIFTKREEPRIADTSIGTFMLYGSTHDVLIGQNVKSTAYLLIVKPYEIFNAQTMKIIYVLIFGTLVVLALAVAFSVFASKFQTRRLVDFSQKAKRLADGDFNVVFTGGGYEEYDNLAHALNSAKDELKKTEKMQRDIIANVSHDIRTPLTMIKGYAEMLRDMPLGEKKRISTADVIISEADRLTALVGDVMNYSKLSSGVAEFKFENTNVSHIAKSVLAQFDIFVERDGVVFRTEIEKNALARCDKARIEQVLYNLLGNAINYCGDDKTVILRVTNIDGGVRVEVSDHGNGIAADELEAVWDRYYRAERATRAVVGSGLGLSICKNILIAHGASYGVRSELGEGTTFWFELARGK